MACVHIRVMADEHVSSADNHRWVAPSVVPAKTSKCIVSLCGVRGMAQLGARQKHAAHSLHGDPLSSLVLQCCCETDGQAERLETDAILEAGWDNAIMPGSKAVALAAAEINSSHTGKSSEELCPKKNGPASMFCGGVGDAMERAMEVAQRNWCCHVSGWRWQ